MDQKHLILSCRFYNGEEEAPEWMSQNAKMFWFYERFWVMDKLSNHYSSYNIEEHPSMRDFEVEDGTPQDLKTLICDRYCHFGGTDESFKEFYKLEYQVRPTNLQRVKREQESHNCKKEENPVPKHTDRFYWKIAYELIKDDEYYRTVHKCGVYQGKRVYKPIFKDEYILEPPSIGLPLIILVDDDGNAEYIRARSFEIYDELRKSRKSKSSAKKSSEK